MLEHKDSRVIAGKLASLCNAPLEVVQGMKFEGQQS